MYEGLNQDLRIKKIKMWTIIKFDKKGLPFLQKDFKKKLEMPELTEGQKKVAKIAGGAVLGAVAFPAACVLASRNSKQISNFLILN